MAQTRMNSPAGFFSAPVNTLPQRFSQASSTPPFSMRSSNQAVLKRLKDEYTRAVATALHLGVVRSTQEEKGIVPAPAPAPSAAIPETFLLHRTRRSWKLWPSHLRDLQDLIKEHQRLAALYREVEEAEWIVGRVEYAAAQYPDLHNPALLDHLQRVVAVERERLDDVQKEIHEITQRIDAMHLDLCCNIILISNGLSRSSELQWMRREIKQATKLRLACGGEVDFEKVCSIHHLLLVSVSFDEQAIHDKRQGLVQRLDLLLEKKQTESATGETAYMLDHAIGHTKLAKEWLDEMVALMEAEGVASLTPYEAWRVTLNAGLYCLLTTGAWEKVQEAGAYAARPHPAA